MFSKIFARKDNQNAFVSKHSTDFLDHTKRLFEMDSHCNELILFVVKYLNIIGSCMKLICKECGHTVMNWVIWIYANPEEAINFFSFFFFNFQFFILWGLRTNFCLWKRRFENWKFPNLVSWELILLMVCFVLGPQWSPNIGGPCGITKHGTYCT